MVETAPPLTARHEQFDRDGYLIERGLLAPEEAAHLRDYYMEIHRRNAIQGHNDGVPEGDILKKFPRLVHPHRTDPLSKQYMLDPRIFDLLGELFGEEPLAAQSMMYYKPPGARGQALHQDQMPLYVTPGTCIACWIALDPADRENGGMLMVPGSHLLGVLCNAEREVNEQEYFNVGGMRVPEGHELVQTELEAGDAIFFGGLMIHGSHANRTTDRFRRCFIGHYVGRSTESLAKFYHPLLTQAGEEVGVEAAPGGGPCGARPSLAY